MTREPNECGTAGDRNPTSSAAGSLKVFGAERSGLGATLDS